MAPRPTPRSGYPGCPALPCPVWHHRQGMGSTGNGLHRERANQAFQTTMFFPMAGSAGET